jgi:hypothetical protein
MKFWSRVGNPTVARCVGATLHPTHHLTVECLVAGDNSKTEPRAEAMEKRKVGPENGGYSAHTTPLPTKMQRPSLTPLQQDQEQQLTITPKQNSSVSSMTRELLDSIDEPNEMKKLLSKYGELLQSRKSEVIELKQRNFLRQSEEVTEAVAMVTRQSLKKEFYSHSYPRQENHRNGIQRTVLSQSLISDTSTTAAMTDEEVAASERNQPEEGIDPPITPLPRTPVVCHLELTLLSHLPPPPPPPPRLSEAEWSRSSSHRTNLSLHSSRHCLNFPTDHCPSLFCQEKSPSYPRHSLLPALLHDRCPLLFKETISLQI